MITQQRQIISTSSGQQRVSPRAFTLIELLVVIAIILVLAALIVGAGRSLLGDRAKVLLTTQRMNQALTGLSQYTSGSDLVPRLQALAGLDLNLVSLRTVVSRIDALMEETGSDFSAVQREVHLPPNIGNRWEAGQVKLRDGRPHHSGVLQDPMNSRPFWPSPETNLDSVVTFIDRQISIGSGSPDNAVFSHYPNLGEYQAINGTDDYVFMTVWDDVTESAYIAEGSNWRRLPSISGKFLARRGSASAKGETLDGTMEVYPGDAIRNADWYRSAWPNLIEAPPFNGPDGEVLFSQHSWPLSDWDQSVPGDNPPIWHWPWGKRVFTRIEGRLVDQIEYTADGAGGLQSRTLADLSPLYSMQLLQAAGVLPAGEDGMTTYRSDRDPSRGWNDAWGSPIILGIAHFMPARYDYDDVNDLLRHDPSGEDIPRPTSTMFGGRDYFLKKAETTYGYRRSFYVSTGSVGDAYLDIVSDSWEADQDSEMLRDLWKHLTDVTEAERWDGHAMTRPLWGDYLTMEHNSSTYFLSSPIEIK